MIDLRKLFGKRAKLAAFQKQVADLRKDAYLQKVLIAHTFNTTKEDIPRSLMLMVMDFGGGRKDFPYHLTSVVSSLSGELDLLSDLIEKRDYKPVETFLTILVEQSNDRTNDSLQAYQALFRFLAHKYETSAQPLVGTPVQNCMLESLIERNCTFIKKCAESGYDEIGENLKTEFADHALTAKKIYDCDFEDLMFRYVSLLEELRTVVVGAMPQSKLKVSFSRKLPRINGFSPILGNRPMGEDDEEEDSEQSGKREEMATAITELKQVISGEADWSNLGRVIADYHMKKSALEESDYFVLSVHPLFGAAMIPIKPEFRMSFTELVGYDTQKELLRQNTEKLLAGRECNHVLIHGPQGCGKSTMVNALLTEYTSQGLRVVQLQTGLASALPAIFNQMGKTPYKYIVLIDEFEIGHKSDLFTAMKQVIEGSFMGFPSNSRLYVISNDDKCAQLKFDSDEQEKLLSYRSLEDRFGLVIEFPYPGQELQIQILKHYLGKFEIGRSPDTVWPDFQNYCAHREIEHANPRNIRDFVKTL